MRATGGLRIASLVVAALVVMVGCGPSGPRSPAASSARLAARGVTSGPVWISRRYEAIGYSANALADGRILLAGGYVPSEIDDSCEKTNAAGQVCLPPVTATAELYDPSSASFSPTGPMTEARREHRAVTLHDGSVLVIGGLDSTGFSLGTAELYDPATGRFTSLGALEPGSAAESGASTGAKQSNAIEGQTVAVLADGRVLIVGGTDVHGRASTTARIFDPEASTFAPLVALPVAWAGGSASVLPNGKVLLTSGITGADGEPTDRTMVFDPGLLTFTSGPRTTVKRAGSRATVLRDGRVLLVDGMVDPTDELPNCGSVIPAELFDPAAGGFTAVRGPNPSWSVVTVRTADGPVLLLGGTKPDCTALRQVAAFLPGDDTFTVIATGFLPDLVISDAFALADGTFLLLTDQGLEILSLT